jgi:hypothetical protein
MSRDLTSDVANAFSAATVKPVVLAKLDFASGAVRVHSGIGNLTFASETYTGVGTLGTVSDITESIDPSSNSATLTLSAASAVIALALTEVGGGRNRAAKVWLGAKNLGTDALLADPALVYSGFISHITHRDDGTTGSVQVHLVNETGDQERALERRYTNEDQQRLYPGDTGFQYVADLPNKEFTWGNARVFTAGGGGNDDVNSDGGESYMP